MLEVSEVRALPNYRIWVRYEDGVEGEVDLSHYAGKGVFEAWTDEAFFRSVHVAAHGSIAWDENIELCPETIYLELTGKKPEDVFPRVGAIDVDA
jgi:hypothetical protein